MFFSTKTVALVATLFTLASAAPAPLETGVAFDIDSFNATDIEPATLVARQQFPNEGIYLVNCQGGRQGTQSQMNYYQNAKSGSQNGQQPDSVAVVQTGSYVTWEGRSVSGNFNGGGSATSNIQSGAASRGVGQFAGTARNSFGQNFNCFRDNGRQLHNGAGDPSFTCNSIYYCFDVS